MYASLVSTPDPRDIEKVTRDEIMRVEPSLEPHLQKMSERQLRFLLTSQNARSLANETKVELPWLNSILTVAMLVAGRTRAERILRA